MGPSQSTVACLQSPVKLRSASFEERAQLTASRRMSELPERLGLDLTDALARHGEALSDFFEGVLAAIADAKPHLDDLLLPRRQRLEDRLGLLLQIEVDDGLGRRHDLAIL